MDKEIYRINYFNLNGDWITGLYVETFPPYQTGQSIWFKENNKILISFEIIKIEHVHHKVNTATNENLYYELTMNLTLKEKAL